MRIIVAGNMSKKLCEALLQQDFQIVESPCNKNLLPGLCYHPDMQIAKVDGNYICDKGLYEYYLPIFENEKLPLFKGDIQCQSNYPEDIAYNIKVVSNNVFHNFTYTDSVLMSLCKDKNLIHSRQGYSGCSICTVGDNAIITSDRIIHQKALENGVSSLMISAGHIELDGFDYGFIGGASFCVENVVYFFGSISRHPDFSRIEEFCNRHKVEICSLTDDLLTDYGSAITLD